MIQNKIGKISVIPKDYSNAPDSPEKSLRQKGYSRSPGSGIYLLPHRETNTRVRNGLDPNARYISSIPLKEVREAEVKRVTELRDFLQQASGEDLSPESAYYRNVDPVKLLDGDNLFPFSNTTALITYAWLAVHPAIAPSLTAYNRGDVSPDTVYYVNDEDIEEAVRYKKTRVLNDAITKLNSISVEKRKKIGALLNLPISDNTKEEAAYNMLDALIRTEEFKDGPYKYKSPAEIFNMYVSLDPEIFEVRSLVDSAFKNQIYRIKLDKVYEGEQFMWNNKEDMVSYFLEPANQGERLALEKKLNAKKLALV